jgi:monoamine oxidase
MKEVIIIGGGLSGLAAGYYLKNQKKDIQILEANDELGGRIKTVYTDNGAALEMGATWIFNDPNLKKIIQELGLNIYKQYNTGIGLYEVDKIKPIQQFNSGGGSYHKLAGGTYQIISELAKKIGHENIVMGSKVYKIEDKDEFIRVHTSDGKYFDGKHVILTIPPRLLESSISFLPNLSSTSNEIRSKTHTWMGESAKFSIEYSKPFWRDKNLSGLAISMVGLIRETQDHVSADNDTYALVGFLNLNQDQINLTLQERKKLVVLDLVRLFGEEANNVLNYEDYIWSEKPLITVKDKVNKGLYPHQNNGNIELVKPEMNKKLFFAGAETSYENPGVMEGAVKSAKKAVDHILLKDKTLQTI